MVTYGGMSKKPITVSPSFFIFKVTDVFLFSFSFTFFFLFLFVSVFQVDVGVGY